MSEILKLNGSDSFINMVEISGQLSEDFIRENADSLDFFYLCSYQTLSEFFMIQYQDRIDWVSVSRFQKLSEEFIHEFRDKVDWFYIIRFQNLSDDFINAHVQYLDIPALVRKAILT
jgi:hypothetical protein